MIVAEETAPKAADEDENYFVSMTDMMVGVLFIFIIMLMVFALNYRSKTDDQEDALRVAKEIAAKLKDLQVEVHNEIATLDQADQARRRLLEDIKDQLLAVGINVEVDETSGVLRLTEDAVRFSPNSAELDEPTRNNVGKIASVLEKVLPAYAACKIDEYGTTCENQSNATVETVLIEGHTDATGVADASERDRRNWQLSSDRAINTYRQLVAIAPSLRALRNRGEREIVSVSGYSSTRPIDATDTRNAWALNRRIDLRFIMEVDSRARLKDILVLTDEMKNQIERLKLTDVR